MKRFLIMMVPVLVVGCATVPYQPQAREVKKKPRESGLIALNTKYRPEDRERAESLMAANCGAGSAVKVNEEGEVVVGEKTNATSNKRQEEETNSVFSLNSMSFKRGSKPVENVDTSTETVQLKEWQISYSCEKLRSQSSAINAVNNKAKL